jgi:hypothetical protein
MSALTQAHAIDRGELDGFETRVLRAPETGLEAAFVPVAGAGGGRVVEVAFDEGFPFAQGFAPDGQDLVCFEPMTAPVSALTIPGAAAEAPLGGHVSAAFRLAVRDG